MSNAYIGEIRLLPYSYAPRGWTYCNGQEIPISQYPTAYAVIGLTYGGDGRTTFRLPDLQGRIPLSFGSSPGTSNHVQGQMWGFPSIQLTQNNLPTHIHTMKVSNVAGQEASIDNLNVPAQLASTSRGRVSIKPAYESETPTQLMNVNSLAYTGGNSKHENRQPYLVIPFCICLDGVYPTRS